MKKLLLKTTLAMAVVMATGCASNMKSSTENSASIPQETSSHTTEADLNARALELDRREAELTKQKSINTLLPPDAQKGECYARVWVPEQYKTVSEQMLATEASERIEIIPAQYGWKTETVEVSAQSNRLITTPAVYGTETETLLVSDEKLVWRRELNRKSPIVSDDLLTFAREHGADINNASPGMCFHEHLLPAKYTTEQEKVLVSEASEAISVIPATYRMVEKTIVVSEASSKIVQVPETYKTISQKIMVKPAHTVWKKGKGPIQRIDSATGEIMCLIEVPAEYKTVHKRVVATPATTKTITIPEKTKTIKVREQVSSASEKRTQIPAKYKIISKRVKSSDAEFVWHNVKSKELSKDTRTGQKVCLTKTPAVYKTVTKRVVKTPASTREVIIPAKTKEIKVKTLISEAKEKRITIPATYKTVSHQELVKDGYMQWRSILCETNTTPRRIAKIQSVLQSKGFYHGPIDGIVGSETIRAVNAFQKANNLPVDKYLNVETIRKLGVSVK